MNINQIEVKGITYQVEDAEARSGLAQAVVDIDTIKEELPKKAVFNDIPWTEISSKVTVNPNSISLHSLQATKISGLIIMQVRGIWKGTPGKTTSNLFTINDETWYGDMVNDSTIGIITSYKDTAPFLEIGRANYYETNKIGCGENNMTSNNSLIFSVEYKALHP